MELITATFSHQNYSGIMLVVKCA